MQQDKPRKWSKDKFEYVFEKIIYAANKYSSKIDLTRGVKIIDVVVDEMDSDNERIGIKKEGNVINFYVQHGHIFSDRGYIAGDRISLEKLSSHFSERSRLISPDDLKKKFLENIGPPIRNYLIKNAKIKEMTQATKKEISEIFD